jgi:hypothetical protein
MYRKFAHALVAACAVSVFSAGAWAESIERSNYDRIKTVKPRGFLALTGEEPSGANELQATQSPSQVGDRTYNITQPEIAVESPPGAEAGTPVQQSQPAPETVTKPKVVKRKRRTQRRLSEAQWWKKYGNPKVFAFRECVAGRAEAQARKDGPVDVQAIIAEAVKSRCKETFADLSRAMAKRFGAKKAEKLAGELTGSTFVPAINEAVAAVRKTQPVAESGDEPQAPQQQQAAQTPPAAAAAPAEAQPITPQVRLALAKEEMFNCYREMSDRVVQRRSQGIDADVDFVLLECSGNTRAFFKHLFEVYPHPPARQSERMRRAVADDYRPAIARRITGLRQQARGFEPGSSPESGPKTASSSTGQ